MNILFINTPTQDNRTYIREGRCMQLTSSWAAIWPPLSLITMGAIVQEDGHKARVFDANVQPLLFEDIPSVIQDADLVVLNTSFPTIESDIEAARLIKKNNPGVVIVAFGVFFSLLPGESFPEDGALDYAIVGEPEQTLRELLERLSQNRDALDVPGLLLSHEGKTVFTGPRELIEDLDSLPKPDRSLIDNAKHVLPNNGEPFTLVNTSRGCPFHCTFCIVKGYYGQKVRRHSTAYMLDEIEQCQREYGLNNFLLWEEAFTLKKETVRDFCNGIMERGLDIKWAVTTRADTVDLETLRLMKKTGCFLVGMGIESGSQDILDRARKQEKIEDIIKGVQLCKKAGLPVMGHFIFGLPGETKQTAEDTIKLAKRIGLTYLQSYCAVPYPGTEFGELAAAQGWVTTRRWSMYNFGGESIVDMPGMPPEQVTHYRRKAFRAFYYRPGKILSELLKLRHWRNFMQALSFLRWTR